MEINLQSSFSGTDLVNPADATARPHNDTPAVTTLESYLCNPVLLNQLTDKVYELLNSDIRHQQEINWNYRKGRL